uniref:Secreted protein n=1 Tax=Ascaris lumbricoides TaxID=6252 RepID=A0A0M3HWQ5_ASCLU
LDRVNASWRLLIPRVVRVTHFLCTEKCITKYEQHQYVDHFNCFSLVPQAQSKRYSNFIDDQRQQRSRILCELIAIVFYSLFSTSMSRFAYVILVYSKETIKLLVFHSFCCISNKPPIESCESQIGCFTYSNLLAVYSQLHLYIKVCKNV